MRDGYVRICFCKSWGGVLFRFSSHPLTIFAFFSLSLPPINSRNSDPGSQDVAHALLPPHLSPRRFVPRILTARRLHPFLPSSTRVELQLCLLTVKTSGLSSLVDSRRIVPTHATSKRCQQLVDPSFFCFAK